MIMTIIKPIRGQTGLRGREEATVTTGAYGMHACRLARGSKWGGKEVIDSEAVRFVRGWHWQRSESETWCEGW